MRQNDASRLISRSEVNRSKGQRLPKRNRVPDSDVIDFMSEFARYLVAAGMTNARFTEISRLAFYEAASVDARFGNRKLNQSAVAAMTGLTRPQVRGFSRGREIPASTRMGRLDKIIEGWTADPVFTTSTYTPKRLSIGHRNATFNSLVRKYGGDVPARSVLREFVRTGCVTVHHDQVSLNPTAHRTLAQLRLRQLSQSLVELLKEPSKKSSQGSPLRVICKEVSHRAASAKGRILVQKRVAESLEAMTAELKAAGEAAAIELPPAPESADRVTRTRIVLISEELDLKGPK